MVAGHLREGLNRVPPVLLLAAFCLPLFFGLGLTDLENDEAIYSYAVESILATGDWLSPRISPSPDIVFLEKPPLKFWIVAAPIRAGLLPYNEFGLRVWDALFGGVAFVYVFLIGRRLAGAVCGIVALLVLFGHGPLVFIHGLRSNTMEAALFLAYCGGIYHYLALMAPPAEPRRWRHIAAVTACFYLGFMTKFVAAIFLPMILAAAALLLPAHRRQLIADRRRWLLAGLLAAAGVLPWFVYQHAQHGAVFWQVIVGEHVYTRFTESVDPGHVRPWHFYVSEAWLQLGRSGSAGWAAFGLIVLAVRTVRQRTAEQLVVLLWLVLPVSMISLGTSKLYHYFYPYLPPIALGAGYGVAWLVERFARLTAHWRARRIPRSRHWLHDLALLLAYGAAALAVMTAIRPVEIELAGREVFSNHSVLRPLVAALGLACLGGRAPLAAAGGFVLLASLVVPSPLEAYGASLSRLMEERRPLKDLSQCLREVDAARRLRGQPVQEPYAPVAPEAFLHTEFYYLRGTGWLQPVDDEVMRRALFDPSEPRPVIIDPAGYDAYLQRARPEAPLPPGISHSRLVILLPGEYAACQDDRSRPPR
jgi:4-amino-4-deoxy-L-arabinose transferase-like glycosyltransferase